MASNAQAAAPGERTYDYKLPFVIGASAAGTTIEWYDFYLYGVLAVFFEQHFFPPGNEVTALLSALATFGAGFAVRPFGAVIFGRIGDLVGRKFTFLLTISIMGGATALVGLLPTYSAIGLLAPVLLVTIRLLQGLALGASTAARPSTLRSTRPTRSAASSPPGSRQRPPSACCLPWR